MICYLFIYLQKEIEIEKGQKSIDSSGLVSLG